MPLHDKRAVRILNPASGPGWTSRRRACEYVRQKRAWRHPDGSIEFISGDPRHMAARVSVENDYDIAARTGIASIEAIQGVPVVGPIIRLLTLRSKRRAA
jgi:hypothetical protein